ncbi:SpoIID/LytB domain-containing protein [Aquibacillus albus]|uniref:SpoIID/LytB domain protein n=1 Tax=Aquibacillus albus TaxID=1168171 RepID=A0ABS2MX96_9BACI|nr:SpoIID/LytB domain-containing protein [Aquibacillus albus]MBM7570315.1 SpoIID/LytB domain protein [Aquibacillus albus]
MKNLITLLSLYVSIIVFPQIVSADDMMRVQLVNHVGQTSTLEFELEGKYFTLDPTMSLEEDVTYTLTLHKDKLVLKGKEETYTIQESFMLIPKSYDEQHIIRVNDRPYLGAIEMKLEGKEYIRPVNQLPLEDYLKGVVPFEVFPSWGLETLKAQALAARTYAASHMDKVIDDTISYQVYGGYTWSEQTTKAVNETKGEVITYNDNLIDAYYSASNGGMTETNAHVWGGKPLNYFPIKKDPYDPIHPWEFSLEETQIELEKINFDASNWWEQIEEKDKQITASMKRWLNRNGYPGDIKILSIPQFELSKTKLDSQRRVKGSITIEFLQRLFDGTILFQQMKAEGIKLNRIRPMIGGDVFKSYLIDSLDFEGNTYTMKGRGYGHGVGMSQWGAYVMGDKGKTYKEIIEFYYPKTTISKLGKDN